MIILTSTPISCANLMVAAESSLGGSSRLIRPTSSQPLPCNPLHASAVVASQGMQGNSARETHGAAMQRIQQNASKAFT